MNRVPGTPGELVVELIDGLTLSKGFVLRKSYLQNPSKHLPVQSKQQKHYKNVSSILMMLFWCLYCYFEHIAHLLLVFSLLTLNM